MVIPKKIFAVNRRLLNLFIEQITNGNRSITGMMLESHINEGSQSSEQLRYKMKYGVFVTDACISWETNRRSIKKITY